MFIRKIYRWLLCGLACTSWVFSVPRADAQAEHTVLPTGATWNYLKGTAEASNPGDAWRAPGHDDSGWSAGEAPFHYGSNASGGDDEVHAGTILGDMRGDYTCVFLRRAFVVTDASAVDSAGMLVNYDDGFVAWVNGTEVARANVSGDPDFNDVAGGSHEGSPAVAFSLPPDPASYFVTGTNLLAVQAFNRHISDSSDFRFETDLRLVYPDTDPPVVIAVDPAPGSPVGDLVQITVTFSEPVTGVDAADLRVEGLPASSVTAGGGQDEFTFHYAWPVAGSVYADWDEPTGIADGAGNPFVPTGGWAYVVQDVAPPAVAERHPVAGAEVSSLTQLQVTFSEPVRGVHAADLLVAGAPAAGVSGLGAGPYLFQFSSPPAGVVQFAWAAGHGIEDLAPQPNAFGEPSWTVELLPSGGTGEVFISEFVASNLGGLVDEDGDREDWIEISNAGPASVNLLGWSLTDDPDVPGKWVFPVRQLDPGQHLVVFASGKDRYGSRLHTNFRLNVFGEYLALFGPDAPLAVADALDPAYPDQRNDYAYGRNPAGQWRYYASPSPGTANGASSIVGVAPPPHFSVARGCFDTPFNLLLTSTLADAAIRYTLDGTEPTAGSGYLYAGALAIADITTLRAAAFKSGYLPSRTVTHSYLYLGDVPYQPNNPAGYPSTWGSSSYFPGGQVPADYEMDLDPLRTDPDNPGTAIDPARMQRLQAGLRALPVVSMVMDPDDMFGPSGLYPNSSSTDKSPNEKPVSLEMWLPDGSTAFTIQGGLDLHGHASRDPHKNPKHGFKLSFRGDYGESSLVYQLFPDSPATDFDDLILRPDFGTSWRHWSDAPSGIGNYQRSRGTRTRDAFFKHTLRDMGRLASHNRYFHLFINGIYWGTYDFTEQPTADFGRRYFGGTRADYDVYDQGVLRNGTATVYNQMLALSNLADDTNYQQMQDLLDVPEFIDYMLMHFYVGAEDWGYRDTKNWYAIRQRTDGPDGRFKYIPWDGENILLDEGVNQVTAAEPPSDLHTKLIDNAEYRLTFADHVHRHMLAPDGALTVPATLERWAYWQGVMDEAIVAESCRWGDYRRDVHPYSTGSYELYTRENHWMAENTRITGSYLPGRNADVLNQLRAVGLYPDLAAPAFNQQGGWVAPGFEVVLTAPAGTIYYTTNGDDPRVYRSGDVAGTAVVYTGPVALAETTTLRARVRDGSTWSALNEATFLVGSLGTPLRISEIMYNPPGGDAYEFVEVINTGPAPLDIGRFSFEGINYLFPEATALAPGSVLLLASGAGTNAFHARYPAVTVFGYFGGALANGGERIAILDRDGHTVTAVHYDDEDGWPAAADGGGASLEVVDALGDPGAPANWRADAYANGTPGIPPPPPAPPGEVLLNEVMAYNLSSVSNQGAFPDWVELHHRGAAPLDVGGWSLTDNSDPRKYVFPAAMIIDPGGFLVVWCDEEPAAPGLHSGFALGRNGESVFLYDDQTNLVDAVTFGHQVADYSIGRIDGDWTLTEPTPLDTNQPAALAAADQVAVNEWMADAPPGVPDWLEFFNRSAAAPVALGGLYLGTGNATFRLPALSYLAPLAHLQLFADEEAGPGHLEFKLPAAGGDIVLSDATGRELERVSYAAQAAGVSEGRLPDGTTPIVAFVDSPSPGAENYLPAWTGPVLNEVLARSQRAALSPWGSYPDFVELVHAGGSTFDLSGMTLGPASDEDERWSFPPGTQLDPGQALVVWCDDTRPTSGAAGPPFNTGFPISGDGEQVVLFNAGGQAVDAVTFGPQATDRPIGLDAGAWRLLDAPTPAAPNAGPAPLGAVAALRINEWMADPDTGPDWFELYNPEADPVSLGGLFVTDDPSITGITNSPVPALSFIDGERWLVFTADGDPGDGADHVDFRLDTLGETLRLYTADLTLIDAVDFGIQPEGGSQGRLPDGDPTISIFPDTPSPGEANYLALTNVVINEVLTHTDPPFEDAVELHNPSGAAVDIGGWYLSDSQTDLGRYRIPDGTILPAGGYAAFYQGWFGTPDGEADVPPLFSFNSARGDAAYLSRADGAGRLTGHRAGRRFGAAANGVPVGRYRTSLGDVFTPLSRPSFGVDNPPNVEAFRTGAGASNAYPLVGPVVINEIMYHPAPECEGDLHAPEAEFVELHNLSGAAVPLYDPAHTDNRWRLDDAVQFTFPAGTAIPAGAYLVVVPFDPAADADALARFNARYGTGATLVGPYDGRLADEGETVVLYRPDTPQAPPHPDAGFVPQLEVDRVAYADDAPWPAAADGGGASLQRDVPAAFGNDPVNWRAEAASPGRTNFTVSDGPPVIVQPPGNVVAVGGEPVTFSVIATGTWPLVYQWLHEGSDLPGANATNLLFGSVQPSDAGAYQVRVTNHVGAVVSDPAALIVIRPPRLEHFEYTGTNGLQAVLNATADIDYLIETSTNLQSWTAWMTLSQTNDLTPLFGLGAGDEPFLFYRAVPD